MRIYGDLFTIQGHFLTMLDANIKYPDVYVIHCADDPPEQFYASWARFIDENCMAWEVIDHLESIGNYTQHDVHFWEDDDDEED
jgi:hypothetical protein